MDQETPAQALQELDEAIQKYLATVDEGGGYLVDWMLVTAQHMVLQEGTATGIAIHVSAGQSLYRTAGLARYAAVKSDEKML